MAYSTFDRKKQYNESLEHLMKSNSVRKSLEREA